MAKAKKHGEPQPDSSARRDPAPRTDKSASASTRKTRGPAAVAAGRKAAPSAPPPNRGVFLIGYTGSGKSTVGRLLAIRMGNHFVDLEQEISLRAGMATPMIFGRYGEEGYRSLETKILQSILESTELGPTVIATGEGIVDTQRNIETMRQRGLVCFLHASFDEILRRLGSEVPVRPILHDQDALLRNYDLRTKVYGTAAHVTLATDGRDPSQIVQELSQKLDERDRKDARGKGSRRARTS